MHNLFFRTNLAPYRIDIYNAIHKRLNCEMYFYWKEERSQSLDMAAIVSHCRFTPHYLTGVRLFKNSRKFCTEVWKILRKNNPEIVIVPEFQILTVQVLIYKWLFRKKFRIISMCDDSFDMLTNNNDFSLMHKCARKVIAPLVDDILLVDSRSVDWYRTHYNKGLWLPIIRDEQNEIELYQRALPISKRFNEEYNLVGKKVLLFVGRLVRLKNLSRLIVAIGKTHELFTTVIIGDGPELEKLKSEVAKINKEVIFAGHFEGQELRAWYNIADVFILPSYQEAYGAVTNEALIAGNYCLVSNLAGSACLINENNGLLLDPFDEEDMAKKIDIAFGKVEKPKNTINLKLNRMNISFAEHLNKVILKIQDFVK